MSDGINKMHEEYHYYQYLCKQHDEFPISIYDEKWVLHFEELEKIEKDNINDKI